jgi:DNA-binding NtrC family response regulator
MWFILVISDNSEAFRVIRSCYPSESNVDEASNKEDALDKLQRRRYDFLFIDLEKLKESVDENGYKPAMQPLWHLYPTLEIIVMSSRDKTREAVSAVKEGASDYLIYPIKHDEVKYVIESIHESIIVQSELDYLRGQFWEKDSQEIIKTKNPKMKIVFDKLRSVAPTISTVMLTGETGTGKGVLANLIHSHSNRREAQFISVHCGAIPDTLLESELFGHEKGAFTGAVRRKLGKFEIASEGTIFLDEIGTITPAAQIKLLQVLQDGTFQRVGGEVTIKADVRVIGATNMDLKSMCDDGHFRKDLYYRLNVFPIEIPPLRERLEDIPHLTKTFLKKMNRINMKDIRDVSPRVMEAFQNYPWPGNIREMENLLERAYILETSSVLQPDSFPSELFESQVPLSSMPFSDSNTLAEVRHKAIENVERHYLKRLMEKNRGRIKESAKDAGITTRQLHKLLTKYGIRKEEFKLVQHRPHISES